MASSPKNPEDELRLIFDALAESVAESSEEEIQRELEESGEDVHVRAESVRALLLDRVRRHQKRRLDRAREEYQERLAALDREGSSIPETPQARRRLLELVFRREPSLGDALLTAQHREFTSLDDDDVASYLAQLAALGVLEKYEEHGDE
jgi:hypothetical protein